MTCENSSKWDTNTGTPCPCHFWYRWCRWRMKANKTMVNDLKGCAWPSGCACPRGNTPVRPEAKVHRPEHVCNTQTVSTNSFLNVLAPPGSRVCAQRLRSAASASIFVCRDAGFIFIFLQSPVWNNDIKLNFSQRLVQINEWCAGCFNIPSFGTRNDKFAPNIVMGLFIVYWPFTVMDALNYCNKTFTACGRWVRAFLFSLVR